MHQRLTFSLFALLLPVMIPVTALPVPAGEKIIPEGRRAVSAVFDLRQKDIARAAIQIDLIHQSFYAETVREGKNPPRFVIVFGGAGVRLVSNTRTGYTDQETTLLDLISARLETMAREGIRLEACLFAADTLDIDPATLLSFVHPVENGWLSLIGYQARGYSLVPVF
ncbi:MAG: hypothetical protein Kow0089_10070 [Desulfobulbaceae bacterium]